MFSWICIQPGPIPTVFFTNIWHQRAMDTFLWTQALSGRTHSSLAFGFWRGIYRCHRAFCRIQGWLHWCSVRSLIHEVGEFHFEKRAGRHSVLIVLWQNFRLYYIWKRWERHSVIIQIKKLRILIEIVIVWNVVNMIRTSFRFRSFWLISKLWSFVNHPAFCAGGFQISVQRSNSALWR